MENENVIVLRLYSGEMLIGKERVSTDLSSMV